MKNGDPEENRTPVTAVKGRCLDRLTTGPLLVGVKGFEPSAPCSQSTCATGLRYTPKMARTAFRDFHNIQQAYKIVNTENTKFFHSI